METQRNFAAEIQTVFINYNFNLMKSIKTIVMAALAIVMFGFASCNKENKPAKKVVGTYKGYTLASSNYFSDMFTADEKGTFTLVNDNTVKIEFTSNTWGSFTFDEALVEGTAAPYKVTGNGKCQMVGMGGQTREYDCTVEANISGNGKDVITFNVPAVMGGTTVVFTQGTAPVNLYVAGKYTGIMSYGVSEMSEVEASVELKAQGDDKISIVLPAIGEGMMSLPEITLKDIAVDRIDHAEVPTDQRLFIIAETEINQTVGTTNYTGTLGGNVDNGKLTLNYSLKPGAMPMSITFKFVSE